jgi:hypothetical protein
MALISSDWGLGLLLWLGVAGSYAVTVWKLAHQGPRGGPAKSGRARPMVFVSGPRVRVEPRNPSAVPARANASRQGFGAPIGSGH